MTQQAINSIKLYAGGNPGTIYQLLQWQRSSVVDELLKHFRSYDLKELAITLSAIDWVTYSKKCLNK